MTQKSSKKPPSSPGAGEAHARGRGKAPAARGQRDEAEAKQPNRDAQHAQKRPHGQR